MPIEFRCCNCQRLLRVGDAAGGKQAQCPGCRTVQAVPSAGASTEPREAAPLSPDQLPGFAGNFPGQASPGDNPYASPASTGMPWGGVVEPSAPRSGPAWERDGASIGSFLATAKEFYFAPLQFFSHMRRRGGVGPPLNFAAAGGILGFSALVAYVLVYQAIIGDNTIFNEAPPRGAERTGYLIGVAAGTCCCPAVMGPLAEIVCILAFAGLFHLTLMLFGGARFSYETTLRVVAYAVGNTMLMLLVPFCGFYLSFFAQAIYVTIGLAKAQECSGGTAAAAVFLPALLCGAGFLALIVAFAFTVAA